MIQKKKGRKIILNGMARIICKRKISQGLINASEDDVILISDLDEIPNLTNVNFPSINNKVIFLSKKCSTIN